MGLYALSAIASSVLFAWLFNRSGGSIVPVLVLHTAVNAWFLIIPVMVLPDGSNLRPSQIVVGILVLTAIALLLGGERSSKKTVDPRRLSGAMRRFTEKKALSNQQPRSGPHAGF